MCLRKSMRASRSTSSPTTFASTPTVPGVRADSTSTRPTQRCESPIFLLDLRNSGNQVPDPDAVSQFNVVTNNFSAQLGRYSGAVVSIVTKGGTNQFHGSAFEFFRDRNFNAIAHNSGVGATKNPYNQHRFGGTLGGPIRRDKDL